MFCLTLILTISEAQVSDDLYAAMPELLQNGVFDFLRFSEWLL